MDLVLGPVAALIGAVVPDEARDHLTAFTGERTVSRRISDADDGDRVATAWLGPDVALGAESGTVDLSWWDQFHAATAHWRRADGTTGWLRARVPGPSDATVEPGRLVLRWHHDGRRRAPSSSTTGRSPTPTRSPSPSRRTPAHPASERRHHRSPCRCADYGRRRWQAQVHGNKAVVAAHGRQRRDRHRQVRRASCSPGRRRCWPRASTRWPTPATRRCSCSAGRRAKKAANEEHPFGYGRERYFWSFVVALVLFTLGSVFAIYEGIHKLQHPEAIEDPSDRDRHPRLRHRRRGASRSAPPSGRRGR